MPDESIHLGLPYLAAAQAQKHVTHNEALRRLDAVVQLAVIDRLAAPPGSPEEGDRYIVDASATGAWVGHDGDIAAFIDGAWAFFVTLPGWIAYDAASGSVRLRQAGGWESFATYLGTPAIFGINTTADATNRLAVRSNAVLLSGIEAADGGTGDVRFTINKEADGDTASLLFQSAWSGRAEIGLAGDTDFVFKVSPDGSAWTEAIRIDKDTGLAALLYDNTASGLAATTVQDAIDEVAAGGGGGGGSVASVFGRTGSVVGASGDYEASEVNNDSGVAGASVSDALDTLDSGKQPLDATLTAFAGVGTASDKLIYATGSDAFSTTDLTSTARGLLDDTSISAMRTTLGLAIGSDVQAYDADLATIAGLTATTDHFLQAKASAWSARSPTQVTADLVTMAGDSGSGGTKGLVPAPASGDAAAEKFLKADGTWTTPAGGGSAAPAGALMAYAGTSAPALWLFCYGQAISRSTYSALFTAIGTTYGAGDGSTTFNLPDLRGRVIAGQDDMGGTSANRLTGLSGGVDGDVLGGTGGAEAHTLTVAEMPAHKHTLAHHTTAGTNTVSVRTGTTSPTATNDSAIGSTGGDGAHNNVQPTIILNWIIYAAV